jgi:hypothetical protein
MIEGYDLGKDLNDGLDIDALLNKYRKVVEKKKTRTIQILTNLSPYLNPNKKKKKFS